MLAACYVRHSSCRNLNLLGIVGGGSLIGLGSATQIIEVSQDFA